MTSVAVHADQAFARIPGGIGTYLRELVPALARADPELDLTLFHARADGRGPEAWMKAFGAVELPHRASTLYPSWALLGRPRLPSALAGCDVIHAPSPVAVPPAGPHQRLVVTVHDLAFRVAPHLFPRRWAALFRLGLRRAVARADALIAVSRHTASDLVRLTGVPSSRVHVVPLAAAPPPPPTDPAPVLRRLGVTEPYLLFVGTLEPRKNLVRLVRAYRAAVRRGSAAHSLVLAGPLGWGLERLKRELAIAGPGRVVLTGRVPADDLDALYRGADALAYPSLYEGFGLPVVEAMARGVPTIVGGSSLPEVAGDAALAVDPRSVDELSAAIERLLTDERERERLRRAGRERAAGYSWDRTARATLDVYRSARERPP